MTSTLRNRYKEWGFPQETTFKERQCIRINTNVTTAKKVSAALQGKNAQLEKVPFLKNAYYVEAPFSLASSIEYLAGAFYIQEAPAQIPVLALGDIQSKKVCDLCAAPGGKTTQLAEVMQNKGTLVAYDPDKKRAKKLQYNVERMQAKCDIRIQDGCDLEGTYDAILLDAPCSGNFTQDPKWFEKRTLADFKNRQTLQKKLVTAAITHLKKDGILIYSTCSLEKEENEDVVLFALSQNMKLEPITIDIGHPGLTPETKLCKRFWPTQDQQPGFFIAKLRKQ